MQITALREEELLQVWEQGWNAPPLARAVLLAAAAGGQPPEATAALPIGARDRLLWHLRARLFGTWLEAITRCPVCRTEVEIGLDQQDLLAGHPEPEPEVTVHHNGQPYRFRTPASTDLAVVSAVSAVAEGPGPDPAVALIRQCVAEGDPEVFAADPGPVLAAWEQADPLAEVTLRMTCPDCDQEWDETLDVAAYLWRELDAWCRRTLADVHDLARAYGWSEPQVLALSPWRRQIYLGLVTS